MNIGHEVFIGYVMNLLSLGKVQSVRDRFLFKRIEKFNSMFVS